MAKDENNAVVVFGNSMIKEIVQIVSASYDLR